MASGRLEELSKPDTENILDTCEYVPKWRWGSWVLGEHDHSDLVTKYNKSQHSLIQNGYGRSPGILRVAL